jgi:hypothetical protein
VADEAPDAEALFVDPRTRDVFVVLKDLKVLGGVPGIARFFQLKDQKMRTGELNHAVNVANPVAAGEGVGTGPVAADVSRDGGWIAVKNYQEGFLWPRGRAQTVAEALAASPAPCRFVVDGSEALTFEYGSTVWTGLLSLKEDRGGDPPLRSVDRTGSARARPRDRAPAAPRAARGGIQAGRGAADIGEGELAAARGERSD